MAEKGYHTINKAITALSKRKLELELCEETNCDSLGENYLNFGIGFRNLVSETFMYRQPPFKVRTKISENGRPNIEILSSGPSIDQTIIDLLNNCYNEGKLLTEEPSRHGSKIAGWYLAKVDAKVIIENCNEPPYTAKNIILFD